MKRSGYSVAKLQRYGYLFILPTLLFFSVFLIYPIFSAFTLSFYEWSLLGPKIYVGLKNFADMIGDQRVINSLFLTLHFSVVSVILINILAFVLAIMFSSDLIRFKSFLQSLVFLPVVLSIIAVGVVWEFMFQSNGVINILSRWLFGVTVPWLVDTRYAPYALIIVYVWKSLGYYMVIYIAGLLNVPGSLYESARIDGAGFWGRLVYITLPSLKNTIALAVVSCMIFTFGQFPLQYVITKGGPSRSTEILALLIFQQGFAYGKFGYASVISVLFFVTLLIFSTIQLRIFRSESSRA